MGENLKQRLDEVLTDVTTLDEAIEFLGEAMFETNSAMPKRFMSAFYVIRKFSETIAERLSEISMEVAA